MSIRRSITAAFIGCILAGALGVPAAHAVPSRDDSIAEAGQAHPDPQTQLRTSDSASASTVSDTKPDLVTDVEEPVTKSGARRMHTVATYFPEERRVMAITHTWNNVMLTGFTGGVMILFEDANGRVIGATDLHTYGVDGTWIGDSDQLLPWEETLDAPWLDRAVGIRAVHSHAGRIRLKEMVKHALEVGELLKDFVFGVAAGMPSQ